MDANAERALARLRQGDALDELARMVVDQATRTPLREIASPRWMAGQLAMGLEASTSPTAQQWLLERLEHEQRRWTSHSEPLRNHLPEQLDPPLRDLLSQPWTPDEDLVFRIIDQAAIRDLMRHVLTNALLRFRKRLSSVDQSVLGGLGKRASRRGKGLLSGLNQVGGNLGGMASEIVSGVRQEVEEGLDSKVREFARQAAHEQIRAVARYLSDPEHADAFAQLRLSVLDTVLDTPVNEVAAELDKFEPERAMDIVSTAIRSALQSEGFVDRTEERLDRVLDEVGDGSLASWLEEVGLTDVWTSTTTELISQRLHAVVATDAFSDWWVNLFEE